MPHDTQTTPPFSLHRLHIDAPTDPANTGREWLLTNGLGGFAMGTVSASPSRRYHGLLIAATAPPVGRIMAVSGLAEYVLQHSGNTEGPGAWSGGRVDLTHFCFEHTPDHPASDSLASFTLGANQFVTWTFVLEGLTIERRLTLHQERNAATVEYTAVRSTRVGAPKGIPGKPVHIELRPFTPLRGFHDLPRETVAIRAQREGDPETGRVLVGNNGHELAMGFSSDTGTVAWHDEPATWTGLRLSAETARGQDDTDHPPSAGVFRWQIPAAVATCKAVLTFAVNDRLPLPAPAREHAERAERIGRLVEMTGSTDGVVARLVTAGDQFVVRRGPLGTGPGGISIIAGYPWFSDWGRDTMICVPGLLLSCGRHAEALATLRAFAKHQRRGLIPNRFEDRTGMAEYNTVDASLWFVHACTEYLRVTGDAEAFEEHLRTPCMEVIGHYRDGTDDGIGMDPADALITQGNPGTQLTWMDALRNGIAFTPRHGKPVEINALWHHALVRVARAVSATDPELGEELTALAQRVGASFRDRFIRPDGLGLFDRLEPSGHHDDTAIQPDPQAQQASSFQWKPVPEIRPNQLFAASLEDSPLSAAQRRAVVKVCREHLLTPEGMRTLSPMDPAYKPRFRGDMMERDAAYHQGTVWPWLIGAYAEGLLRAESWSEAAVHETRLALAPLIAELDGPSLNQLFEVYDGDGTRSHPREPGGCPAQAWSVAEVLRVLLLCDAAPTNAGA